MKPLTKLFISLLTASFAWIVIEINTSVNTMHFFNIWSVYTFLIISFLFACYMKLSQTNEIH